MNSLPLVNNVLLLFLMLVFGIVELRRLGRILVLCNSRRHSYSPRI